MGVVGCQAPLAGGFHAVFSGLADGWAAAGVFVVGGDVSDAGVQPDRVVVVPDAGQLGTQRGGVGDRVQVRVLAFDVTVEGFDPCLIGGGAGSSEVLGDDTHGHEFLGRSRGHLWSVVGHDQQHWACPIVGAEVGGAFIMAKMVNFEI